MAIGKNFCEPGDDMAGRVKIKLHFMGKSIDLIAIANAGYETNNPEILIPEALAKKS